MKNILLFLLLPAFLSAQSPDLFWKIGYNSCQKNVINKLTNQSVVSIEEAWRRDSIYLLGELFGESIDSVKVIPITIDTIPVNKKFSLRHVDAPHSKLRVALMDSEEPIYVLDQWNCSWVLGQSIEDDNLVLYDYFTRLYRHQNKYYLTEGLLLKNRHEIIRRKLKVYCNDGTLIDWCDDCDSYWSQANKAWIIYKK